MQYFNIHTHTTRCNHAVGTDEEYVIAAIKNGLKLLGFSDHVPFDFPIDTHVIRCFSWYDIYTKLTK